MSFNTDLEYPLDERPDTPLWSENLALAFNDPVSKVSGLFGFGTWFHDTSVWRETFAVALPDGRVLAGRNFGRRPPGKVIAPAFMRYEIVEPAKKVRLSYDGPVHAHSLEQLLTTGAINGKTQRLQLALDFDGTSPVWDMHSGHGNDSTSVAGAMHIEQLGSCNGLLKVDGIEIPISKAHGTRDHSRGPRNFSSYRNHCWIQGSFPSGRSFHVYAMKIQNVEGIAMANGVVFQDGIEYPATVEHIEFVESAAEAGRAHTMVLKCALGEMKMQTQKPYATMPVALTSPANLAVGIMNEPHALMLDEPMTVEWNGEIGYGWSERGFTTQPV